MSLILDALKKSEADRQQQSNAEFAAVPVTPSARPIPRWLWIFGFLVAVNLAVLASLSLRPDPAPSEPSLTAVASSDQLPASQSAAQPSFEQQVATARQGPPQQQAEISTAEPETNETGTVRPVLISQDPSAIPAEDLYPSLQEFRASGRSDLPELHLDIHVYSTEPEDRFVFINMSKLREGSRLDEGPVVAEIRPDGVVLEHQGQLFLLPRE